MKKATLLIAALFSCGLLFGQGKLDGMNDEFTLVAEKVVPKVVSISVNRKPRNYESEFFKFGVPFGPVPNQEDQPALGSGVIIDKRGYIVTNNHVIEDASSISVTMSDGKKFKCTVVGSDPASDIAVIKIDGDVPSDIPVIDIGDSSKIKPGQIVFAVGNAFGLSDTVTMGIVSAVHREGLGIADYENLIQTDAAINPGNSGGALVDVKGRLLGINNAIFTKSGGYMGVGFAIPSNTVKTVADELIKGGRVVRGWLGVKIQEINEDIAEKMGIVEGGAIIAEVMKNSPAEKSGFVEGDIILEVNKNKTKNLHEVRRFVAAIKPGDKAEIVILRGKEKKTISVSVGKLPETKAVKEQEYRKGLGLNVKDLDEETSYQYGLREKSGVVVTYVQPGSPAEKAGIFKGDVVKKIENVLIADSEDFNKAVSSLNENPSLIFLIKRGGNQQFVVVKMK